MTRAWVRWGGAALGLGVAFTGALLLKLAGLTGPGTALIVLGLALGGAWALAGDAGGWAEGWALLRARARHLARTTPAWASFLAASALLKVPVPLWPAGFTLLGTLSTVCLALAATAWAWRAVGRRRALAATGLAVIAGLGVEVLGSRTGFPFGTYSYAGAPGVTVLGVPIIVPLGWWALTLAAAHLARGRAWLAGLLLVAWDVGLEPLMTAQGYWTWTAHTLRGVTVEGWAQPPVGLWAGAPLQNFVAWGVIGALLVLALRRVAPGLVPAVGGARGGVAAAYAVEAFFLPGGLLLLGRPLEAAVTLLVMGVSAWISWRRA
ncbi:carotenoid biosynthesis protein [Deinococcus maricopensis]|uniref:Carotenoid biosynthesis protein n=1 Tax=Deinococcus maricopensis (strain DSM 21211 / LMG 22137 / NRRL B-23946 / LB-34) TaxID=709986 RepID=E8U4M4_DEIML|nr:carotenoid biosynthesis protein [Deinococcus maricopensis]ADV68889.1 protein of unknown function DUF422 [Deinococcus maricopensis DSM 21211]